MVTLLAAATGAVAACGSSSEPPTVILRSDGGNVVLPKSDAAQNRADVTVPSGTLRLVHAAVGLPAIDFCTRSGPQDLFDGPVLGRDRPRDGGTDARMSDSAPNVDDAQASDSASDADASSITDAYVDAGAVTGVAPASASQYVSVTGSGTLEVAIVPAGTGSCGQPLATGQVTLEPGRLKTVIVFGLPQDAGRTAGITAFDDTPDVIPNRAKLRLIYAAVGPAPRLTATLYSTLTTTLGTLDPLAPLRPDTDGSLVDGLGYANVDPRPPPTTLGFREAQSATATQPADLGLTGGSVHTGFILPTQDGTSLLYCNDVSTDGPRTQCTLLLIL